jgi:hypothetical protein
MGYATAGRFGQIIALVTAIVFSITGGRATAGPFANLDFEDSPLSGATPPYEPPFAETDTSLLFPAWTLWISENVQTKGWFNTYLLAGAQGALMASDDPHPEVIQGTKSLFLSGWVDGISASVSQSGDVPPDAKSVRFIARNTAYRSNPVPPSTLFLRMNGQNLPLVILGSTGTGDFEFGADISPFAGATANLRFGVAAYTHPGDTLFGNFDSVSFSLEPIPEPATPLLIPCVLLALFPRRQVRR